MSTSDLQQSALQSLTIAQVNIRQAQRCLETIHPLAREIKAYQDLTQLAQELAAVMQDIGRIKL